MAPDRVEACFRGIPRQCSRLLSAGHGGRVKPARSRLAIHQKSSFCGQKELFFALELLRKCVVGQFFAVAAVILSLGRTSKGNLKFFALVGAFRVLLMAGSFLTSFARFRTPLL